MSVGEKFKAVPLSSDTQDGWLAPDGLVYPCTADEHDQAALWLVSFYAVSHDLGLHRLALQRKGFIQVSQRTALIGTQMPSSEQNDAITKAGLPRQEISQAPNIQLILGELGRRFFASNPVINQKQKRLLIDFFTAHISSETYTLEDLSRMTPQELAEVNDALHRPRAGYISHYEEHDTIALRRAFVAVTPDTLAPTYEDVEALYPILLQSLSLEEVFQQPGHSYILNKTSLAVIPRPTYSPEDLYLLEIVHEHSDQDLGRGRDITLQVVTRAELEEQHRTLVYSWQKSVRQS